MAQDIDAAIERMKREMDVQTDAELAAALKIGATAVSAWRSRGKIPLKYQLRSSGERDKLIGQFVGSGRWMKLVDGYVFALIGLAGKKLPEISFLLSEHDSDNEIWLGFRLHNLYEFLQKEFQKVNPDSREDLRFLYEKYRTIINGDDLVEWIETV